MKSAGSVGEWLRFLEVSTEDDAAHEILRQSARLEEVYAELKTLARGLSFSPGGEIDESLHLALTSTGEAIDVLTDVLRRVRAGDAHVSV